MLDIEYRYSGRPTSGEVRRADWEEMEKYLRGLVYEMQEADISSKYIGKKTGKISRLVKNRTGRHLHVHSKLIGYDMGKSGLSESWRAMEKDMVK